MTPRRRFSPARRSSIRQQAATCSALSASSAWPRSSTLGAAIGILAGIAFALFEMIAAWAMDDGFWMPLRMIGAIVLGDGALEASYSLAAVVQFFAHTFFFGTLLGAGLAPRVLRGAPATRHREPLGV